MSDRTYHDTDKLTVPKSELLGPTRLQALRDGAIVTVTQDGKPIGILYADEFDVPRRAPLEAWDPETGRITTGTETPEPLAPDQAQDTQEGIRAGKELLPGDREAVVIEPCAGACGRKVAIPMSQYNRAGRYACAECAPVIQRRDEDRRHGAEALGRAITEQLRKGVRSGMRRIR